MTTSGGTLVDTTELRDLLDSHAPPWLIDVRTAGEFDSGHIRGALNVPLDLLREHRDEISSHLNRDVVLICRSGQRAAQAGHALQGAGLDDVLVLHGGMTAWTGASHAVEAGAERWELERQVRLVAGSVVLTSILGSVAAPRAKWLAAAIGGGLTFAAVSNTCAMGMLLAKLPYNHRPAPNVHAVLARLATDAAGPKAS